MSLTVKQQKFADEYIKSGNATEAAIKAGYSKRTAYSIGQENLKKVEIANYLEKRMKEISDSKVADQQEILEYLSSVMRGEQTEDVATAKGIYKDVPVGARDRIKAAELLGKRSAMWTEKHDVNARIASPVQIIDDIPKDSEEDG
ncbi:terminase small subunit [Lactobacillus sp. ESL0731]|uniref:terminase small subunit n=1 Tax=unclassified Lactobacillus TaxID=2620435 RepID=UPI0023F8D9C7|nr:MULTISPECIES: terminase small subunit [unclassified Lactobacillus]WEV51663.1 terminase small subunit [Lactobacillus sp. ESL0700]WEV62792.1 terminase small subunit [Lactobacillus sp. ESL0731]